MGNPFAEYIETGQIDFSEGNFKLFDQSMVMFPITTYINLYRKIIALGEKGRKILYDTGVEQIKAVFSVFDRDYNIKEIDADTFANKFGPTMIVCGWGGIEISPIVFEKGQENVVTIKKNPYAIMYKELIGKAKQGVDDYLLGLYAGGFEAITAKKVKAVEAKCIAKGDSCCEFRYKII